MGPPSQAGLVGWLERELLSWPPWYLHPCPHARRGFRGEESEPPKQEVAGPPSAELGFEPLPIQPSSGPSLFLGYGPG